ncbi:hypothetical protein H206_05196 [Candidatus Electrothrix aarhusensis]|uniref:Uncharacterized protein n=1 Tax=Candidatus Electrothrix aarhusensis TaxID=1859131 RepID=A0A444J580_9BACT|nr:hypothetical protein H206_05196 [Candidatus Electrothrix aarhusensis]
MANLASFSFTNPISLFINICFLSCVNSFLFF